MADSHETLQDLIHIQSYSGKEGPIQSYIQDHFANAGIETIRQGDNVLVHLKGQDQTRAFIFNGHVDVVDAGDEARWKHNPWSGDIVGGRVYGRGAADMKMGVAAEIELAKRLAARDVLACDVWFSFVAREEIDGSGTQEFAQWFVDQGYTKQYREMVAIFAEPSNLTEIQYGHRGNFFIKASIDGDAGHASRPGEIKTHAVVRMTQFIGDALTESNRWKRQFKGGEFAPPTITPTGLEAHTGSPNKVSDHAQATFDLRTIPGFHGEAYARIKELAAKRGIKLSLLYPDAPTGYTRRDAAIITLLKELVPHGELKVGQGSADLGFLTQIGVDGVLFGPGEEPQSHVIDESSPIAQLDQATDIYERLYDKWASR